MQGVKLVKGLQCPVCGCKDILDQDGRPWTTSRTIKLHRMIRRYRICRNCGKRIRTREVIDGVLDKI